MLDPFTLLFVLAATLIFATCVLTIAWYVNKDVPGVGEWALGFFLAGIAWFFFASRASMPLMVSVLAGNAFLLAAFYLNLRGTQKFMGHRVVPFVLFIGFAFVVLTALSFWTVIEPNFPMRAGIVSIYLIFFNAFTLHALWPRNRDETYVFAKLIGALMALSLVKNFVLLATIVVGMVEVGILDSGPNLQFMYASAIATIMLMAMGYIALITEYLHKGLREQAERDYLTGAYNRRAFYALAEHVLKRHQRDGDTATLIMMDLDHFKAVNDTHGHVMGDEVLKRTVKIAQGVLRGQDILVRLGGEEFAALLPATSGPEGVLAANRIREAVETQKFNQKNNTFSVTASLGLTSAIAAQDVVDIDEMIAKADMALYDAKEGGRNRISVNY